MADTPAGRRVAVFESRFGAREDDVAYLVHELGRFSEPGAVRSTLRATRWVPREYACPALECIRCDGSGGAACIDACARSAAREP